MLPSGSAVHITHALLFAVLFLFALAAPGFHYGRNDVLQAAAGGPEGDSSRELKVWIEAGHSFVCPADGTARLPLKVRGVGEGCRPQYSWKVNGGVIEGEGAGVVWNLYGVRPQPDKYYDAVVTVKTGPSCGSRKASAVWRACVVCPPVVTARVSKPTPSGQPRFCPTISFVTRPAATAGEGLPVTATLNGGTPGVTPWFKWTVWGGRIKGGQETNSVSIEAGKAGQTVIAKVEVGGYRTRPPCSATCSIPVVAAPTPTPAVLTSVRLTPASASLGTGAQRFTARAFDQFARPLAVASITFESADRRTATVGSVEQDLAGGAATAVVNGRADGTTRIVATAVAGSRTVASEPALMTVETPPKPKPTPTPSPAATPSPEQAVTQTTPTPTPDATKLTPSPVVLTTEGSGLFWLVLAVVVTTLGAAGYLLANKLAGAAHAATGLAEAESAVAAAEQSLAPAAGATKQADEVHCTAYAPPSARPDDEVMVQVFVHLEEQAGKLDDLAVGSDPDAQHRGSQKLSEPIEHGRKLFLTLQMRGLEIDETTKSVTWNGKVERVCYDVVVPADFKPKKINSKVVVSVADAEGNLVPVATLMFKFEVTADGALQDTTAAAEQQFVRHRKAFISYASENRDEVAKRVQMLRAQKIECFWDVLTLEQGEEWESSIYRFIDQSDIFYLFWSEAAKNSPWVAREIAYALCQKATKSIPPDIMPIAVQVPAFPPPKYLEELHFNDATLFFMKRDEAAPGPPAQV